ncbi:ATP-binding protein [Streptomyces sp. NPDC020917]|uniref:ATP-binding protein n=1 Tax=Streptomyces sp. NPDC020917 TaxID=3365102 RepID=UPI0037B2313B
MNSEISTRPKDFNSFRLPATRHSARLGRHLAIRQLAAWGHPHDSDAAESVAAIVAELAANAATHGRVAGRAFELTLALGDGLVRIEVSDTRGEVRPPEPGSIETPAADAESGRGLLLVQALAKEWGVAPRDVGKTVWAEVALSG